MFLAAKTRKNSAELRPPHREIIPNFQIVMHVLLSGIFWAKSGTPENELNLLKFTGVRTFHTKCFLQSVAGFVPMSKQMNPPPTLRTPLQNMKEVLEERTRLHGSDAQSVRMLRAKIARCERDLEQGPQTQAEMFKGRPFK